MNSKRCLTRNIRTKERKEPLTTSFPCISCVPFPPEISVEDIVCNRYNRTDQKRGLRPPNSYIIYRLAYIKELKKWTDANINMRKLSPFISRSWEKESREVKERYKEISNEIRIRLEDDRKKNLVYVYEKFPESTPPAAHGGIIDSVPDTETFFPSLTSPPLMSSPGLMPHSYYPADDYVFMPDIYQMDQNINFWPLQNVDDPLLLYNLPYTGPDTDIFSFRTSFQ